MKYASAVQHEEDVVVVVSAPGLGELEPLSQVDIVLVVGEFTLLLHHPNCPASEWHLGRAA
jgi:hypothetical protein